MSNKQNNNSFRIIGGRWRSRQVTLHGNEQLRPTPSRVRETLFNWLNFDIIHASCLDLFAGSGALGIEALSRGAGQVEFVEVNVSSVQQIKQSLQRLEANPSNYVVSNFSADEYIVQCIERGRQFDIVFLDPPFRKQWWEKLAPSLESVVHVDSLIYLEVEKEKDAIIFSEQLASKWEIFREKTAGQVRYYLLKPIKQ